MKNEQSENQEASNRSEWNSDYRTKLWEIVDSTKYALMVALFALATTVSTSSTAFAGEQLKVSSYADQIIDSLKLHEWFNRRVILLFVSNPEVVKKLDFTNPEVVKKLDFTDSRIRWLIITSMNQDKYLAQLRDQIKDIEAKIKGLKLKIRTYIIERDKNDTLLLELRENNTNENKLASLETEIERLKTLISQSLRQSDKYGYELDQLISLTNDAFKKSIEPIAEINEILKARIKNDNSLLDLAERVRSDWK
jgi:Cu/Ag efflux protein CusF